MKYILSDNFSDINGDLILLEDKIYRNEILDISSFCDNGIQEPSELHQLKMFSLEILNSCNLVSSLKCTSEYEFFVSRSFWLILVVSREKRPDTTAEER